jgi:hypothetical protein
MVCARRFVQTAAKASFRHSFRRQSPPVAPTQANPRKSFDEEALQTLVRAMPWALTIEAVREARARPSGSAVRPWARCARP